MLFKDYSICYLETLSMLTRNITDKTRKCIRRDMKCTHKEFQIFYQKVSSTLAKRYTKYVMKRAIKIVTKMIVN